MDTNLHDANETLIFLEILYRAIKVYLWCDFACNTIVVLIGRMNFRRNTGRRLEEEIANAGAPPYGEQVTPLEEDFNMEQASVNHPPWTDGDISAALIQLAQAATVQAQAMTAQANWEVVSRPHQQVSTMAFHQGTSLE